MTYHKQTQNTPEASYGLIGGLLYYLY
jgi:hypothetical protein